MSAIWRSYDAPHLSDDLRDMLRRRLREIGGLALLALAATAGVALATWSAQDPSLTHATHGPIRNMVGSSASSPRRPLRRASR
jgi:S-DNA-T family DNA segregation ATPase FtsK/SpoIIIE